MNFSDLAAQTLAHKLPPLQDWPLHYEAVLITGPTASGKSALGMLLAQQWPASIISVDSALVYTGMDIGTAKPSKAEQAQVPHHLIDLIDPAASYSVAQFLKDAQAAIIDCTARTRMPVLVGGTMMYVNALYKGLSELPQVDAGFRVQLSEQAAAQGWPALHALLQAHDPITAAKLAPHDAQRIERALSVFQATGTPLSTWLAQSQPSPALFKPDQWLHLSIEPDKARVWQRIEQRFDAMLTAGLVDEVAALRARSDLNAELASMRCVGYRQVWQHLDGALDASALRERGIIATRQLAKRQMTWLRSMPLRTLLHPLA